MHTIDAQPTTLPYPAWATHSELQGTTISDNPVWQAIAWLPILGKEGPQRVEVIETFSWVDGEWVTEGGPKVAVFGDGFAHAEIGSVDEVRALAAAVTEAADTFARIIGQ